MGKFDKLSVFISLILRHKPSEIGIQLDEHGWANVVELINGINNTGRNIDLEILKEIVRTDNKQRYSFNEDKSLIRANQGHSIPVDVELKEQQPPQFLYHQGSVLCIKDICSNGNCNSVNSTSEGHSTITATTIASGINVCYLKVFHGNSSSKSKF